MKTANELYPEHAKTEQEGGFFMVRQITSQSWMSSEKFLFRLTTKIIKVIAASCIVMALALGGCSLAGVLVLVAIPCKRATT